MNEINIPNHVAIILDGNRRWAKEHHIPQLLGHKKGFENIRLLTKYIFKKGIKYLSVYAFSTENFKRTVEEVKYLMDMFVNEFTKEYQVLNENNIKVIFSGSRDNLRTDVKESMVSIENLTKDNTGGVFNICLNYGSKDELVKATKAIAKMLLNGQIKENDITEELLEKNLYQQLPPIDLLIRTSGEQRLSNFMLWQNAYAEFYFPSCHWPAFDEKEFDKALEEYSKRNRRFGGNSK